MNVRFTSEKTIELGSCAFRQWRATHSHCCKLHGYLLTADFVFASDSLDARNWVYDFGGMKDIRHVLRNQFDHTTVVAGDDPELELFKEMDRRGIIDLRIMTGGVGVEKSAEWVLKTVDTYVREVTGNRVWVQSVTVREHDLNSATAYQDSDAKEVEAYVTRDEAGSDTESVLDSAPTIGRAAAVGNVKSTGMGNPFQGTSWG